MKKKKIKNPLIKRIPRELLGDWKKYLVVALFLILTIGFVSGMYVANESMLVAANEGVTKYKLEDGHFELDKKADETLLAAIETGTKADVKKYYLDKAKKELDEKLDEKAYPEAYDRRKRMRSQLTVCMQTMSESKWEMRFLSAGRGSKLSD